MMTCGISTLIYHFYYDDIFIYLQEIVNDLNVYISILWYWIIWINWFVYQIKKYLIYLVFLVRIYICIVSGAGGDSGALHSNDVYRLNKPLYIDNAM